RVPRAAAAACVRWPRPGPAGGASRSPSGRPCRGAGRARSVRRSWVNPVQKLVEPARHRVVPGVALPAMAGAELGMLLAAVEQGGLDVGILVGPMRGSGAAIDVGPPSVLQPGDEAARPGFARRDRKSVV